jgi:hypothetical protein
MMDEKLWRLIFFPLFGRLKIKNINYKRSDSLIK